MTQLYYDKTDTPNVSAVLLALYEVVFAPEQFMRFVDILESALSDEAPQRLVAELEKPAQQILDKLVAEEGAKVSGMSP